MEQNPYKPPNSQQIQELTKLPASIKRNSIIACVGCVVYAGLSFIALFQDISFALSMIASLGFAYGFLKFSRVASVFFIIYVIASYLFLTLAAQSGSSILVNLSLLVTGSYGCAGAFQYHKWRASAENQV